MFGNKVNISLYAAYYPGIYDISLNYFTRKLSSKEDADELTPLRLIADALTEAGPLKAPEKWTQLSQTSGTTQDRVLRQTNIGSNLMSTIWYQNNTKTAVKLEVTVSLGSTCLLFDSQRPQLTGKGPATKTLLHLDVGQAKPLFLLHEDSEMRVTVFERFL